MYRTTTYYIAARYSVNCFLSAPGRGAGGRRLAEVSDEDEVGRGRAARGGELFAVARPGEAVDEVRLPVGQLSRAAAAEGQTPDVGDAVLRHDVIDGLPVGRPVARVYHVGGHVERAQLRAGLGGEEVDFRLRAGLGGLVRGEEGL